MRFAEPDVEARIRNGRLWKEMTLLLKSGSLLGAAIRHDKGRRDANMGIENGHCYAITGTFVELLENFWRTFVPVSKSAFVP